MHSAAQVLRITSSAYPNRGRAELVHTLGGGPLLLLAHDRTVRLKLQTHDLLVPRQWSAWLPPELNVIVQAQQPAALHSVTLKCLPGVAHAAHASVFPTPPLLREMMRQLVVWTRNPAPPELERAFHVALYGLVGRWLHHRDELTLQHATSPPLRKGLDWLLQRLNRPVGPVDAARQAGLSLRTFQRRCQEELAMAPSSWLQRARVLRGIELLDDDDLTVLEVAIRCGYQSQASYSRVFKEHLGLTPVTWRERQLNLSYRSSPWSPA
jgi:AraC-like DNA-binding protein